MSAHAVIAPSGLHMTVQCPGSIKMQAPFPEEPTSEAALAAAEGTAAHWAMALQMGGGTPKVGMQADNGVFLTDEMVEASDLIVQDVLDTITPYGLKLSDCMTEVPVDIKRVHALCWGTPDIRVWLPGKVLVVWDLKFGFRNVPVFENDQLVAYDVGCITQAGQHDLDVTVINKIVQPRSYHRDGPIREWRVAASDLRGQVNRLNMAAHEALGDSPKTRVGPACRDCRARHACETLQRAAETAMDMAGSAMPHELPPAALGVELRNVTRMVKLLEARKAALEEQGLVMARRGHRVAHHMIENGDGRQVWKKPDAEVIALGQMLGVSLAKPPAAVTPVQAVKAGFPDALLSTYIERKTGAASLVPDDGSNMRKIFSGTY